MKTDSRLFDILALLLIAAVVGGLALLFINQHSDRAFITYRYVQNLTDGFGLSYTPGDRFLTDDVAPMYVALLAQGLRFTPDIPFLGNVVSLVMIALGGMAVYGIARPTDSRIAAAIGLLYAACPLLYLWLGLEVTFWLALCLIAIFAHLRGWGFIAAPLLAIATLTRPEAAILVVLLIADSIMSGRKFNLLPSIVFGVLFSGGLVWLGGMVNTGGTLPSLPGLGWPIAPPDVLANTIIAGLPLIGVGLIALSPVWLMAALFIIPGGIRSWGLGLSDDNRWPFVLGGWGLLHLVILVVLSPAVYAWHIAPMIPVVLGLLVLGAAWLIERFKTPGIQRTIAGIAWLLLLGATIDSFLRITVIESPPDAGWRVLQPAPVDGAMVSAGDWLRDNVSATTRIGTTSIGVLGFRSGLPIYDYYGRLDENFALARSRRDSTWWLHTHTPEVIVLTGAQAADLDGTALTADAWFGATYQEVVRFGPPGDPAAQVGIWQRQSQPLPLTETLLGMIQYPQGVTLNSIATDFTLDPLETGRVARVRIEWLVNERPAEPLALAIGIQHRNGSYAALDNMTIDFTTWPVRRLHTTYHTITLLDVPAPGLYEVKVGLGTDPLSLTWQTVNTAKVPFPDSVYVGGLAGTRAEFGEMALQGYRVSRSPEDDTMEVVLLWQAIIDPMADYRIWVQVRAADGSIALQTNAEPREGAYPTSIWAAGEELAEVFTLDTSDLAPGDYDVYAGLLTPDGQRVITLMGEDEVLVGRVTVRE